MIGIFNLWCFFYCVYVVCNMMMMVVMMVMMMVMMIVCHKRCCHRPSLSFFSMQRAEPMICTSQCWFATNRRCSQCRGVEGAPSTIPASGRHTGIASGASSSPWLASGRHTSNRLDAGAASSATPASGRHTGIVSQEEEAPDKDAMQQQVSPRVTNIDDDNNINNIQCKKR